METGCAHSPRDIEHYSTEELRSEFLQQRIFVPGKVCLTYLHRDRQIFRGVTPEDKPLEIVLSKELGVDHFLERREPGIINIGGLGTIIVDRKEEEMKKQDGYYIGRETKQVMFKSNDLNNLTKFYVVSTPAHHKYPNVKIAIDNITPGVVGEGKILNKRKVFQYIHPNICESYQLQTGYTILEEGSAWNTMPCHTHERRVETCSYLDMNEDAKVFHLMGKPSETKRIVIGNEEAVISPSWSIHSGVDTSNYTFIWAMCGEDITYDDMDMVSMDDLK